MNRKIHRRTRDLLEIADYLARDSIDLALRFLDAADDAFEKLAHMPGMGRVREFQVMRLQDLRSWPIRGFENYLVFYRAVEGGIEIVRVLHGARDIDAIFEG